MKDDREILSLFETLSNTKQSPTQRQENWRMIQSRMDGASGKQLVLRQQQSGKWQVCAAAVAAVCIFIAGFWITKNKGSSLQGVATDATPHQPTVTSLSLSNLVPSAAFNLQSEYPGNTGYASSDGNYVAKWETTSSGTSTWIEDMSGHAWKVVSGKYYIVGSTPSGDVILSAVRPNANPNATFPSLVYKPGASSVSRIPKDRETKLTRYAVDSSTGNWATIESASTNQGDFIHTWVDINGNKVSGLSNAEFIAWSPDGSKLAAVISVDVTPKGRGPAWSAIQSELVIYNLSTKQITKSGQFGLSGLSWSPDGQVIAVNCAETTSSFTAGFYEFRANDLKQVQQFSIRPRQWGWVGGHTALVWQAQSWDVSKVSWNLSSGATETQDIISNDSRIYDLRDAGLYQCIVQDSSGLWLLTATRKTQIVKQAVQVWWYDRLTHEAYFVRDNNQKVQKVKVSS